MKTKYILHGGSAQHVNEGNDLFYREILNNTPNKVRILLVHFAGTKEKEAVNYQRDSSQFLRNKGNKELTFEVAEKSQFLEQVKNVDVVYFGGGTTVNLMNALSKYKNLKEALRGKIVAGESAGANSFCSYCYSKSGGGVIKCLGFVPVFMFPHYDKGNEADLSGAPSNLERVLLSNYQFRIFEIQS